MASRNLVRVRVNYTPLRSQRSCSLPLLPQCRPVQWRNSAPIIALPASSFHTQHRCLVDREKLKANVDELKRGLNELQDAESTPVWSEIQDIQALKDEVAKQRNLSRLYADLNYITARTNAYAALQMFFKDYSAKPAPYEASSDELKGMLKLMDEAIVEVQGCWPAKSASFGPTVFAPPGDVGVSKRAGRIATAVGMQLEMGMFLGLLRIARTVLMSVIRKKESMGA